MRLVKELGFKFSRREIWHHPRNTKMMMKYDCRKIPMFLNTETGEFICGPTTYEKLRAWIVKQMQQHKT
jgi:hypothetical protein